jgi:hypothetical protein
MERIEKKMKHQSRRDFLKTVRAGTITAGSVSFLSSLGLLSCRAGVGKNPNIMPCPNLADVKYASY